MRGALDDPPITLSVRELMCPAVRATDQLKAIGEEQAQVGAFPRATQGVFLLCVATVEVMLQDILHYYLCMFPRKVTTEHKLCLVDLLRLDILERTVEATVQGMAYKSVRDQVAKFATYLSLTGMCPDALVDEISELFATRNLLLHNDLWVNQKYVESAGPMARSTCLRSRLSIDVGYARRAREACSEFVAATHTAIQSKYGHYTHLRAMRALWGWMFDSPIAQFDEYWTVSDEGDCIVLSQEGCQDNLATSEKIMLDAWRAYFHGIGYVPLVGPQYGYLDEDNWGRLMWFHRVMRRTSIETGSPRTDRKSDSPF